MGGCQDRYVPWGRNLGLSVQLGRMEGEGREKTSYGVETASAIRPNKCLFIVPCLRYF